ncbi:MAG: hypothetical protein E7647_03190 [Ruminococcaceae bacterium]|nr:hypothetical protein [Oscillospiraceae bacterium]
MSKYKIISMIAAALIIVSGCLYLYLGSSLLLAALIVCAVAVCVMGGANAAEVKSKGEGGFIAYIPALCFFVLAAFITAAIVFLLM